MAHWLYKLSVAGVVYRAPVAVESELKQLSSRGPQAERTMQGTDAASAGELSQPGNAPSTSLFTFSPVCALSALCLSCGWSLTVPVVCCAYAVRLL